MSQIHLNSQSQQLWAALQSQLFQQKLQMLNSGSLTLGNRTMKFTYKQKGQRPPKGYLLIFGFHGGGGCAAQVNDGQYNNHKNLYNEYLPQGSIWFTPRSIQNLSDMWWTQYMQQFILQIIHAFVLTDIVDINRVYLTGYSAGGDGIYHLGPRMPDHLAGVAMMAGHPNAVNLINVRNIGFSIQLGGNDHAYNRVNQGIKYSRMLKQLQQNYGGYQNRCKIHQGLPHWMGKKDAQVFNWLFKLQRNPYPNIIIYKKIKRQHLPHFYYLRIGPNKNPSAKQDQQTFIFKNGNIFDIFSNRIITLQLNHRMVNIQQPVIVNHNYKQTFNKKIQYYGQIIQKTLLQRLDPYYVFQDQFVSVPPSIINIYETMLKQFNITKQQKQAQYQKQLSFKPQQTSANFSKSMNPLVQRQRPYPNRVGIINQNNSCYIGGSGSGYGYGSNNLLSSQKQIQYNNRNTYDINQQFNNNIHNPYTIYQNTNNNNSNNNINSYKNITNNSNMGQKNNQNLYNVQRQQQYYGQQQQGGGGGYFGEQGPQLQYNNNRRNNVYQNRKSNGCSDCNIM